MVTPWSQPTLSDIFGERDARNAQFASFLQNRFPTVSSGVQGRFMRSQQNPLEAGFTASRLLGDANTGNFGEYLSNLTGAPSWGSGDAAARWGSGGRMGRLAGLVGTNPQSTTQTLSPAQRAMIANIRSPQGQTEQFNLGITPQMQGLPSGLRQSFYDLALDRYNQVIGNQGTNAGFQFLPWLASQQGNMWGTA